MRRSGTATGPPPFCPAQPFSTAGALFVGISLRLRFNIPTDPNRILFRCLPTLRKGGSSREAGFGGAPVTIDGFSFRRDTGGRIESRGHHRAVFSTVESRSVPPPPTLSSVRVQFTVVDAGAEGTAVAVSR